MNITESLVQFTTTAMPSAAVRDVLRQSFFDWVACGIAGIPEPVSRIVRQQALDDAGQGRAAFLGGGRGPARAASFVNGTTSHALDYDDTHFAHIGHTSVAIFSAVFASDPADFDALIDAACIGSEVAVRVGCWLGRDHYQAGFHQTATAGAFGATAAVARLRGLTSAETAHAFGLAATRAAGLKSQFGTMGKPMNAGLAAECGVISADLAARGMVSNPRAVDGQQGFGMTHHGQNDISALIGLGADWRMVKVSHKLHACCHGLHAMIEALQRIDAPADQITRIEISTHQRWLSVCNKPAPQTGLEVKFSYAHVAAMVLCGRNTIDIDAFSDTCAHDPALIAIRDKVAVEADPGIAETATRVRIYLADQTIQEGYHDLSDSDDVPELKWMALQKKATALIGKNRATQLLVAITDHDISAIETLFTT